MARGRGGKTSAAPERTLGQGVVVPARYTTAFDPLPATLPASMMFLRVAEDEQVTEGAVAALLAVGRHIACSAPAREYRTMSRLPVPDVTHWPPAA